MSKLISNPTECGYRNFKYTRLGIFIGVMCKKNINLSCSNNKKFPTTCPLQDGKTHEQFIEDMKPNIIHVGYAGLSKKRRNRKDCIHYQTCNKCLPGCSNRSVERRYCIGVNCGHFETKKK